MPPSCLPGCHAHVKRDQLLPTWAACLCTHVMMGCVSVYTRDKETLGVAAAAHLHGTDAEAPVDHELTEGC